MDDNPFQRFKAEWLYRREIHRQKKRAAKIAREQIEEVERQHRHAEKRIPTAFDYEAIGPLRSEAKEKLSKIRPLNLDQAKRISGITPADLALVLAHMESKRKT